MRAIRLTIDQAFTLTQGRPTVPMELPNGCKLTSAPMYAVRSFSSPGDPGQRRPPQFPIGHHYSLGGYTTDGSDIDAVMDAHGFGRPFGTSPVRPAPVSRQGSTLRLDNSIYTGHRFR